MLQATSAFGKYYARIAHRDRSYVSPKSGGSSTDSETQGGRGGDDSIAFQVGKNRINLKTMGYLHKPLKVYSFLGRVIIHFSLSSLMPAGVR